MKIGYVSLGGIETALDGTVTYDFNGHVHAQGLDLDAPPNSAPANNNKVRWLRTDNGALVADIGASKLGGLTSLTAEATAPTDASGVNDVNARLRADSSNSNGDAHVDAGIVKNVSEITASATNPGAGVSYTATILDGSGNSDFIRPGDYPGPLVNSVANQIQIGWQGSPLTGQVDFYVDGTYVGSVFPT